MKSIYLFNSGTLKRKDNTLVLENEETGKKYIPVENVNDIKVFSEITLNKRILEFLSQNQIPVYFFNHFGHFSGSFMPNQHHSNGCTILKQAEHYMNNEKRLNIATQFVHGAARNMMRLIGYYQSRGSDTEAEKNLIKHLSKDIDHANTINELMGTEAAIRKIYYQALDKIVKYDAFQMIKREKQPPRNYMNTLISYGNSILYANVLTEIHKTPLDSRIGFLHATNFRRFSLNLDIAEIFRPIIVDRTILSMVNRNQIKPLDFKGVEGGIHLNDNGKKKFITEYEQHLSQTIQSEKLKRKITYRTLIRHEAYKLVKHLIEDITYEPFEMKW